MSSPKELRQALADARADLQATLHDVHQTWERKPTGGDGEESWCPREVAQHVIGADWFFTNQIAQACGAPAMERPTIDVATPAAAAASLSRIASTNDAILRHVSDGDMGKTFEHPRMGTSSVESMLTTMSTHLREHIAQLKAASG